jgi:hypothetical protein
MKTIFIVAVFLCGSLSLAQNLGKATVFGKGTIRLVETRNTTQIYQVNVSGFALIGLPKLGYDEEIFEELESASFRGEWLARASSSIGRLEFVTLYGTYQTRLKIQPRVNPRRSGVVRSSACMGSAGDGVVTGLVGLGIKDPIAQFRRLGFRSPLLRQAASKVLGGCAGYEINYIDFISPDNQQTVEGAFANSDLLGAYLPQRQSIILAPQSKESMNKVLIHELFHATVESYLNVPAWLNEGLAVLTQESLFETKLKRSLDYQPRQIEQSLITTFQDPDSQIFYFPLADYQNQDLLLYLLSQQQLPNAGTMTALKQLLEAKVNSIPRLKTYFSEFRISLTQAILQYTENTIREAVKTGTLESISTPVSDGQAIAFYQGENYSARILKVDQPRRIEFRDAVVRSFDSQMNYLASPLTGQMVQPGYVLAMIESTSNNLVITVK